MKVHIADLSPHLGFLTPWFICVVLLGLSALLPARHVTGYVRDERTGQLLEYRLNGLVVFGVTVGLWLLAGYSGVMPWDWLWTHRWSGATGALGLGIAASVAVVVTAPGRGGSFLKEFYLGRRANPRLFAGRVDAKMFLYVFGATLLELNLLSFAVHHYSTFPDDPSPGVVLYVALFTWFICDYLFFERVHLYTYDLFAERVGFKLVWGCLFFYPYLLRSRPLGRRRPAQSRKPPCGCSFWPRSSSSPAGRWRAARTCRSSTSSSIPNGRSSAGSGRKPSRTASGACCAAASGAFRAM